jgi:glycosyltransferase involved in cell wall biosynthesis
MMMKVIGQRNFNRRERKSILLYFYPSASSFVVQDCKSFQEVYSVRTFAFLPSYKYLLPFLFLKQKLFLIRNIYSAAIIVCQFAGYHSLLPVLFAKLFHKPCLIVVGGTDCVSLPSINYGNLRKVILRWFTLKSLKYATRIISPSISLIESEYTYTDTDYPGQGFRYFDKSITTPYSVINNGIDTSHFQQVAGIVRKSDEFLTICTYINKRNFFLKGLDLFIEMARYFPEHNFTIIGRVAPGFSVPHPANLSLTEYVPNESLPAKMSEFTYYCQLSMSEGFGVALAEAMACGCVPIVSKVGIMDFIVGNSGFILERHDRDLLMTVIRKALDADTESLSQSARIRVVELFNAQIRKSALLQLMHEQLLNSK